MKKMILILTMVGLGITTTACKKVEVQSPVDTKCDSVVQMATKKDTSMTEVTISKKIKKEN